ncbi:1-aminocyclopropane-1-carboxylate deaminase/D-cysteine desulfhydrase [Gilvimarinus xylanilyticus]|uniref:Pyridoxal-phosphate dependent enzyme n=1 Tax=Gilvimarinus xylanilyticus TaxID=2944139 RepID=A0A9X2HTV9_9GAMM|nr:pyridoxal-phosphate dependent enzyme [Gilvimarinus xylanilyticus]MCP8898398.1 pyridoxal-phosphate dependent enzyme [Gilvimarinus xylanilyticus]
MNCRSGIDEDLLNRALRVRYDVLRLPECESRGINLLFRRDDLIDRHCSGNKYYKLYYNIRAAREAGCHTLVTAGGAWSNHLLATAYGAAQHGLRARGVVRGQRPERLSDTLRDAQKAGMELKFVSRHEYLSLAQRSGAFRGEFYVPEGGANEAGERGAEALGQAIGATQDLSHACVCVPVGTGGTLSGLVRGLPENTLSLGFSVLKDGRACSQLGTQLAPGHWRLLWGFHGKGYGRALPAPLLAFWRDFERRHAIALDPVYTLKMLWGIERLAALNYWPQGTKVIAVHTGGLQGRRGFSQVIDWPQPIMDV